MSLTVDFYNYTGEMSVVSKSLGIALASPSCTPIQALDDLTGTIIIDYDAAVENANYAKISTEYYFVTDKAKLTGGKMQINLRKDVLTTYAADIRATPAIIARTQDSNYTNSYLPDNLQRVYANKKTAIKNFTGASFEYSHVDDGYFQIVLGAVGSD